ncbi:L-dopachrome tautomerase yellow-f2-like [Zerene cesonia]|uniref:L-dopachrome tautomerase yellow-f2-like n=1 Tax=Zerene cesonia TaxID=33412 RepID=UPI0018E514B6|nr:L-dopachrome tautomerase yellow-f2-like [Zerene cesonia]
MKMSRIIIVLLSLLCLTICHKHNTVKRMFAWKQINYDFDGVFYKRDANYERKADRVVFLDQVNDSEKFFIQYNNVPIGFEYYENRVFVTVPRRRHGIPSTLNYVTMSDTSPSLRPYPNSASAQELVSVYRPRVDVCERLWMVDTGLLEVPGERRQVKKPSIVIYDLKTDKRILTYELKDTDLVNERSAGGLTSITVDVTADNCGDAYAYINDLATEGLVVFSLRQLDSWRIQDPSFAHDEKSLNFTVAGHVINWKDGLFSIALSENKDGSRMAYYHPLVSTREYAVDTKHLKSNTFKGNNILLGDRGEKTQSGSHGYHSGTKTMFYANVAQDAILCWRVTKDLNPENIGIAAQDHTKLVYISDLKVVGDEVWVLVNQIPNFVFSTLDTKEINYYIHRASVSDLIQGTVCEKD